MIKISPSVLAADFTRLGEQIKKAEDGGADYLHLDVMDGVFVPNISFGIPVIKSLRKNSKLFFDVHLMIIDPIRYIKAFSDAGADLITFHYESCKNIRETIQAIKDEGKKVGVSVKPGTSAGVLKPYINDIDLILVMTVEPGFGGQKFMESAMENVRIAKKLSDESNREIEIEVDGGINAATAVTCVKNGANVLVAGSSVFGKEDIASAINAVRTSADTAL